GSGAREGWSILGRGEVETDPEAVRAVSLTGSMPGCEDIPFTGGWVGWVDYETGAAALGAPIAGAEPDGAWIAVARAIAIDHATGRAFVLADADELAAWHAEVNAAAAAPLEPPVRIEAAREAVARHGVAEYRRMIQECRDAIERGDAYQLCLTTRFSVDRPADPLAA